MLGAYRSNPSMVAYLLDKKADCKRLNNDGNSALHQTYGSSADAIKTLRLLINSGQFDVNLQATVRLVVGTAFRDLLTLA